MICHLAQGTAELFRSSIRRLKLFHKQTLASPSNAEALSAGASGADGAEGNGWGAASTGRQTEELNYHKHVSIGMPSTACLCL
jgi:hypothetical protein